MKLTKKKGNRKIFLRALNDFERLVKIDANVFPNLELIALLGSVANKEEVRGWSDLDILLVVRSDSFGNISPRVIDSLKNITNQLFRKYKIQISIAPHTRNDLLNYVSFEYLRNYSSGKIIYANGLNLKRVINAIIRERKLNSVTKKRYCIYHLRHLRFNLLRKYISINKYGAGDEVEKLSKFLIDDMLEASMWALNFFNIWPKTKEMTLKHISNRFGNHFDVSPLQLAIKLRAKGMENNKKDLLAFAPLGLEYLSDLIAFMVVKYDHPTPEEQMQI